MTGDADRPPGGTAGPVGASGAVEPEPATLIELPDDFFPADDRAFAWKDLVLLAALPFLSAVAWSCPDSVCLGLVRAVTRVLHRLRPGRYRDFEEIVRDYLPEGARTEGRDALVVEAAALMHLERFQLLRHHRPGGWHPEVAVDGREHLERALAQGKGAILWVAFVTFSDMNVKIAMREQGYDVWHLSRHIHGHLSSTRFGTRVLNPIRIGVECRYLADRVVIDPDDPRAAVRRLEDLLADNRVVSITVGAMAHRVTKVPFGPGHLLLAGGAPNLALKSGAPLLPVFTERQADGRFRVSIEPPLEVRADASRAEKIADMIQGVSRLLYRSFERLPAQCLYPDLHHVRRSYDALAETRPDRTGKAVLPSG